MFLKNVDVNDDDDLTLRMARSTINTQPSTFFVPQSYDIPTSFHSPFVPLRREKRKVFHSFLSIISAISIFFAMASGVHIARYQSGMKNR